jgi:hypothetical protein
MLDGRGDAIAASFFIERSLVIRSAWIVSFIFALGAAACGSVGGGDGPDAGFSCPTGETACPAATPDVCVDTSTDNANCGDCGVTCASGQACDGTGHCAETCATGYSVCGSGDTAYCADVAHDRANCGDCGTQCNPGEVCETGCEVLTLTALSASVLEAGAQLTLTGTGFSMNDTVHFGTSIATPVSATDTEIVVAVPADFTGKVLVDVEAQGVASNTLPFVLWAGTNQVAVNGALTGCTTQFSNTARKVAVGDGGQIYVAFVCGGQGYVATSVDGGLTFAAPVSIPGFTSINDLAVEAGPDDTVYVAGNGASVLFATSHDVGQTWSAPATLAAASNFVSVLALGDTVWLFCVNNGTPTVFTGTSDETAGFTAVTVAMNVVFGDVVYTPANATLWAVGDTPALNFSSSTDNGATFGTGTTNSTGAAFFSDWTASGDKLFAAGGAPSTIYVVSASDTSTATAITGVTDGPDAQGHALSADLDGDVYFVVKDGNSHVSLQEVPAGSLAANAATDLGAGSNPAVVAGPAHSAVTAYTDPNGAIQVQVTLFP